MGVQSSYSLGNVTELLLLVAIIYLPPLQDIFGTAPLSTSDWLFVLAWLPALPLVDGIRKIVLRQRGGASSPLRG